MYGMLLESVHYYLIEKYGEAKWDAIRECAGICDHVFVTHKRYSESFMKKIADAAEKVIGEETDMTSDDFMRFFGTCFVKFFTHYGYDRIIRVSGRYLRDFLIGIDNLHEYMRFGYPKLQSPSFFCEEETSSGLTLHYLSKRKGFMFYVVGQVMEIASSFYNLDVDIKILSNEIKNNTTHCVYRLGFDNSGYKPPGPDLSIEHKRGIDVEVFFNIFPFSFVLSYDLTINMAGHGLVSTVGNRVIGNDIRELFTMRRPKAEFTWETFMTRRVSFELVCTLPTLRHPTAVNFVVPQSSFDCQNENAQLCPLFSTDNGKYSSTPGSGVPQLHLRGIMKYIKSWNKIVYICSPIIGGVEEMMRIGLYMNDLGLHDTSREMALSGIRPLPQLELARDHELDKGKALEENIQKLAIERKRSEELLYRMMPKAIADRLKLGGKAVETCEVCTVVQLYLQSLRVLACCIF